MERIARFAPPPQGTAAYETWSEQLSSFKPDREVNQEILKTIKKATAIIDAQVENGAGFPIDKLLRDFLLEFNGRNFQFGLRSMPSSFNVMEAYFDFVLDACYFKLLPEKDHLFSFLEFLDYVTSNNAPSNIGEVLQNLEDSIIYSYNITNSPGDITFSIDRGSEYGFGGVSLVRHGNEVCILLLAGQKTDLTERTKTLQGKIEGQPSPGKESIKPADDKVREAVPLLGNRQFWQTIVLTRIDLEFNSMDVRYVLTDCGDHFRIESDDQNLWRRSAPPYDIFPDQEDAMKKSLEKIRQYDTLFEICKTVLFLPQYFEKYSDDIVIENHSTRLHKRLTKDGHKAKIRFVGAAERVAHRAISVLHLPDRDFPIHTIQKAPLIKTEVSGFWKILPSNQFGTDKHGLPIHGRTWVEKTLTWTQSVGDPGALFGERHVQRETSLPSRSDATETDKGYIYVMRSAAHTIDMFKVGLTRRSPEIRSNELSRTTGSPDKFLVVQHWEVPDCTIAESQIHQRLEQYRVNPDREFFKAPYEVIRQAIEEVIDNIDRN